MVISYMRIWRRGALILVCAQEDWRLLTTPKMRDWRDSLAPTPIR